MPTQGFHKGICPCNKVSQAKSHHGTNWVDTVPQISAFLEIINGKNKMIGAIIMGRWDFVINRFILLVVINPDILLQRWNSPLYYISATNIQISQDPFSNFFSQSGPKKDNWHHIQ